MYKYYKSKPRLNDEQVGTILRFAFSSCRKSSRVNPTSAAMIVLLTVLVFPLGQAQTTSSDPNFDQLEEAVNSINQNQLGRAEAILTSVLAKAPNDSDALNLMGVVRAKQDRVADAERLFRRALSISPTHVSADINLARLLMTNNRSAEATTFLMQAYKLAPSRPDININLATLYVAKSNFQQAYLHLRLVPLEAFNDDYFLLMLRTLVGLKRQQEIHDLIRQFQNSKSANAETQAAFASLLIKQGFNDDALKILNGALKTSRSFPVLYALGILHVAGKQFDRAEEFFTEALTLKADDIATLRALAKVARNKGNLEKALSHLVQAKRIAPNSPSVLYEFGVIALQLGLVLDALPVFQQLYRDHPRELAYLYGLSAAYWTKGEVSETARLMKMYVALDPKSASGWYLLGAALLREEHYADAQKALQTSLNLKSDADTEYLLGESFEKIGNSDAAIALFRKIVQSRPDHAAAHAALGTAYREAGNYSEARTELERAVALDANDLRANYQLGLVYARLGEKEAAQKMFDRADELRKSQHQQERIILKLIDEPPVQ
jgi:Flp pilus assembly protein TadD